MNTNNPTRPRVAIIGAGPSAVYALKRLITSEAPLAILIFESGARPGVGTPYDRQQNSPAMLSNIASIELPPVCETLLGWLQRIPPETRHGWGIGDADLHERHFFPRVVLGDYYADQFGALVNEGAARGHRITVQTCTRVSDIVAHEGGVWVTSDAVTKQAALAFDHAILATGHSVPKAHEADPSAFGRSVEPNLAAGSIRIGILGTSLSGIDVAIDHAMRIGRFESNDGRLTFVPAGDVDRAQGPLITMLSRGGLLPEADFFCPIPYQPLDLFTDDRLAAIVTGKDGDLDRAFGLFLVQLERLDPAFLRSLGPGCTTPEGFSKCYAQRRSDFDPLEWARGNLLEVHYNARHHRTVPWRYALLRMHEPFGAIVKDLSDGDRARFNRSLKRVFVDNYAAVPPLSIERLIALHDAGILAIHALGSDYTMERDDKGAGWHITARGVTHHFDSIVDARGQAVLGQEEFPFPTLRMQIRALAIARSASLDEIVTGKGFKLGQPGNPLERVHCLSLPFLLGRNPFVQGLTAAEELGTAAAHAILSALAANSERGLPIDIEGALASLGGHVVYLFASQGQAVLEAPRS